MTANITMSIDSELVREARKIASPLPMELAEKQIRLRVSFIIVPQDKLSVRKAIEWQQQHGIGFWDAHILATAFIAGCGTVYSEDLQDRADYSGVKMVHPFRDGYTPG